LKPTRIQKTWYNIQTKHTIEFSNNKPVLGTCTWYDVRSRGCLNKFTGCPPASQLDVSALFTLPATSSS
ncbi:hypothetical protein AB0X98_12955, partial [Rothia koreensis]|uniref:hypothetical protein n=1 Tax=Rothia koreensis TaxID=592378 RepID=UPI003F27DE86